MTAVALKDVTKIFPDGTVAVDNVSLDVADGEFMVLLGPSGCGKSTILRIVAGLEEPTAGAVLLNGELANDLPPRERGVAMVFQDYALYPHMTVGENIGFPLKLAGVEENPRHERIADVASALGIADVLPRRPHQLSGGQRQRVAMGRAIVRRPGLFLMDEPLSNLDSGLRAELRAEISNLTRELGVSTIYVTHDQAEALTMADRVAILRKGVLQDVGTPTEVYNRPATLYVAAFLGSPRMNLLEASVYVHLDRYITLNLGEQALYLPWNDYRARAVAHYHGERIVVGVRPEALTPVAPDTPGDVLTGRIQFLEHHGHETLAFLDIGATAIVLDDRTCPVALLRNLEHFFAQESCGWCTPCRDGLPWTERILDAMENGAGREDDIDLLAMHTRFLGPGRTYCAHAPGAMAPLESALKHFREDFERHVRDAACPWRRA